MKSLILLLPLSVVFCQCENVRDPSAHRASMADSGLSPAERERAAKNRTFSDDRNDPLNKVHSNGGTAVGYRLFEF